MLFFTWRRLAGALLTAIPAFFLVAGATALLIYVLRVRQDFAAQTAALALLPVIWWAWMKGEEVYAYAAKLTAPLVLGRRWVRIAVAVFTGWCVAVLLFVWAFEPFGRYMGDREWLTVGKIIVFPAALGAIIFGLYRWANRP